MVGVIKKGKYPQKKSKININRALISQTIYGYKSKLDRKIAVEQECWFLDDASPRDVAVGSELQSNVDVCFEFRLFLVICSSQNKCIRDVARQ